MPESPAAAIAGLRLTSRSGLSVDVNANGSLRRFDCGPVCVALFLGNEIEGGLANVWLRRLGATIEAIPLLGPASPTRFHGSLVDGRLVGVGAWKGLHYTISLSLAQDATAWFWHVNLENSASTAQQVDLTYTQDIALASYGAIRLNEFYVSQYLDHTPLSHPVRGTMIASRQNQAIDGRNPWSLIGSLRRGESFATDALQFNGLATRAGKPPAGLSGPLPSKRLQHEHSLVVVRDAPIELQPQAQAAAGFFGVYVADHRDATTPTDVDRSTAALGLPEAQPGSAKTFAASVVNNATLFSASPLLETITLDTASLQTLFGTDWRHEEIDAHGTRLSFFSGTDSHIVLKEKELGVRRPHGHLLRTGRHTTPDESALTSTAWMGGVFHSMVTQGHVSINRFLSTTHTYLSLFRSHGQRVFAEIDGTWQLLDVPSVFEMTLNTCRWIYRHQRGEIHVRSTATDSRHELALAIEVKSGGPTRFLISHHIALNGDDGSTPGPAQWRHEGNDIVLSPIAGSELAHRFPKGSFRLTPSGGTQLESVGADELLFVDGTSRQQPFLCLVTRAAESIGLHIRGELIDEATQTPLRVAGSLVPQMKMTAARPGPAAEHLAGLAEIAPWFAHNAFVHYLSPRGLEQYSGGGWGTRDVCQGPVEMLLALGRAEPIRDLLIRVMRQQNPDGDWPQWFMFFERERNIRPGDSHGDIVFWPLVVLAQYLIATGDKGVLDERVPYFDGRGPDQGEAATIWQHAERALDLIQKRVIPGTALAAYGHGDWNDSLQPANPVMRERLCSAWTVTLHFQTLTMLGQALRSIGRTADAERFEQLAVPVKKDFQRLLLVDGVLTGYALFEQNDEVRHLLHPSDEQTGVHYSSLAMIHAILEDLLTPEQAREHVTLIEKHLSAPDGVRLFDRPMTYHGGPQKLFQRAESATFFGREIGLMYMHAHLRYAQALAHMGETERFFRALCQANPIAIQSLVPTATLRQANCYYSSSDAQFADRYQASAEYERVADGTIPLDGGWRVYSSGAGIALGLIVRRFLGLDEEAEALVFDPVIPASLTGMKVETVLLGNPVEIHYRVASVGCGVNAVTLNGKPLAVTFRPNPHRRGAALVPKAGFLEALSQERNLLELDIG